MEDQKGMLWIGTEGGGVNIFSPEHEQFIHYKADSLDRNGLYSNYIPSLYEDRSGIIWLGSYGGGRP